MGGEAPTNQTDYRTIASAFLSHAETATYLGIPEASLYQLEYRGVAPRSYKIGRHRKYRPSDVESWCESHASTPRPTA